MEGRNNGQEGYFHHSHVQEVRLRKGEYNDNRVLLVMLGILQTCFGVMEKRIKVVQVSKCHKFGKYTHNFFFGQFLGHLDLPGPIAITWRPLSVVCKLFTFQASSPKPLGRLEPNLAGMFLGWSSTKLLFFRTSRIFNMAARANNML